MAVVAVVAACNVVRCLTRRRYSVMAGAATPQDLGMVHRESRRPKVGRVAIFANVRSLNV